MTLPLIGHLELAATHKADELLTQAHSPSGRYFGVRRSLSLLVLDRAEPERVHAKLDRVFGRGEQVTIHPDGERIAVRSAAALEVRSATERIASAAPDTVRLGWNGERLAANAPPPTWGYASEHLSFTADGRYLVLATHDVGARAGVQLYDADTLALLDVATDLRCYSAYAVAYGSEQKFAPMTVWSESWMQVGPHHPETMLVIRNAGDSALAVFAIEVTDGRLHMLDQAGLGESVFSVDSYFLRGLHRLPQGDLLMMDRDSGFSVIPWPPGTGRGARLRYVTEPLRGANHRLTLPFPHRGGDDLDMPGELSIDGERLLVNIDTLERQTAAILVVRQPELEPIGLIPRPESRAAFGELMHLGDQRFASASARQVQIWRQVWDS